MNDEHSPSFTKRCYDNAVEKKGTLATIATIVVIVAAVIGTYVTLSNNLTVAKAARDEQMKGIFVQLGVQRVELDNLEEDVKGLREWNKRLGDRMNSQERATLDRQAQALEDRINRLEDSAMSTRRKTK